MNKSKLQLIHLLIYGITFYSSFRNANTYLFEEASRLPVLMDYLFFFVIIWTLIFISSKKKYNSAYHLDKRILAVIVLVLWIVLQSAFNSFYSGMNLIPRNLITSLLAFIVIVTGLDSPEAFKKALWFFIIGAVVSAIIPLIMFNSLIGSRTTMLNGTYYIGGIWNQVLISFISTGWLILALVQKEQNNIWVKFVGFFSFIIIWLGSFAGLSRSFFLLTVISIAVYVMTSKNIKNSIRLLLFMVVAFLSITLIMPEAVNGIITRVFETFGNLSEEERLIIWKSYLSNFSSYFLQGAMGDYLDYGTATVTFGTHSVFLNWLVQYGIVGITAFLVILKSTWKEIKSFKKAERQQFSMLVAWLVAYLVQILISETGFVHASFYVGLAFVISWSKFTGKKRENYSPSKLSPIIK